MILIINSLPFKAFSQNTTTYKTQINQPNAPITIDARNSETNYIQIINGTRYFSNYYKDYIITQIKDSLKACKCKCFSVYSISGVTNLDVGMDVLQYLNAHGGNLNGLKSDIGHKPFYGMSIEINPNGNANTGGACIYLYIGMVFK